MSRTRLHDDTRDTIILIALGLGLAIGTWLMWPYIGAFLASRPPGAPEPGKECYEIDWDEWGRPLYECREPTRPTTSDDPPQPAPAPVDPPGPWSRSLGTLAAMSRRGFVEQA